MTFKLRDDALHWRQIEDEVVAVDMKTAAYLGANPAGALLWEALADGATKRRARGRCSSSGSRSTSRRRRRTSTPSSRSSTRPGLLAA